MVAADYDNKMLLTHPLVKKAIGQVIEETKHRLKNSSLGWTQNALARDIKGNSVSPRSPDACSFSLLGAIRASEPNIRLQFLTILTIKRCIEGLHKLSILNLEEWNNTPEMTSDRIFKILDSTIKMVRS